MVISIAVGWNLLFNEPLDGAMMRSRFSPFYPTSYTNTVIYLKLNTVIYSKPKHSEFYVEASRKRYEHIARRIDEALKANEVGMLFIREGHRVQFPQDIEVFSVAPPALDEIRRCGVPPFLVPPTMRESLPFPLTV